ncbi:MAG TPA: HAD family phosphatase [Mycobacteriales bacterium]
MTPWLLVDYGMVISLPFDEDAYDALADLLGTEARHLRERYWQHRLAYDGGQSSEDYWSRVAGRPVSEAEAASLNAQDVAGWERVDPLVLDLLDEQRQRGTRLALLSNAPFTQADAYDRAAWARLFEHLLVSSRLGLTKPDPAIFARALKLLEAAPRDVTFVDDRPENVAAAAVLGLHTIRYNGVDDLRHLLLRAP